VAARRLRGLASSALLVAMLAALVVLDRTRLAPSPYRVTAADTDVIVYGIIALAAVIAALSPPGRRRTILLVAGAIALPIALRVWTIALVGYVAIAIALARLRLPMIVRFVLAFAAWASVPLLRIFVLGGDAQAATILLAQLWVGMLYATLYLIVERARALPGETSTLIDDAFYLLAPPRLVMPFFQPVGPRELIASQRGGYPKKLLARGAGLAGYALLIAVGAHELDGFANHVSHVPEVALRFVAHYARSAHAIMLAMAAFRLLGYDVSSGFRYPFLSRSFADFFRRYNHYVRDAVVSLFYFPILGHLRGKLSRRTASIVAAYVGIFIGSLALQDLLIPCGLSLHPVATVHSLLRPHRILGMLVMWTLIVVPNAGIVPRRRPEQPRWRIALQIVLVDTIYAVLWYLQLR
jgi:hypothetical protein